MVNESSMFGRWHLGEGGGGAALCENQHVGLWLASADANANVIGMLLYCGVW